MTKLTIETSTRSLVLIASVFSLEAKEDYQEAIYGCLKNKLTNEEFLESVNSIINSQETLYNKMPPVATFLKFANKQELTLDQQARIEVNKVINHLSQFIYTDDVRDCVFKNPVTNTAVNKFGGLLHIFRRLPDDKGRSFLKKDLVDAWLDNYNSDSHDLICKGSSDHTFGISNKGSSYFRYRKQEIHYVGKTTKIKTTDSNFNSKPKNRIVYQLSKIIKRV